MNGLSFLINSIRSKALSHNKVTHTQFQKAFLSGREKSGVTCS